MTESRVIGRHAGTVLVGQLAVMGYGFVDTVVAGRYSTGALAALSVGSAVYISVFVALMGVVQALLPTWAELHGAGAGPGLGRSVRQAVYLCVLSMVAGVVALLCPGPLLDATGVPAELQQDVRDYLAVLAFALPPALLFRMYSTLNQSLGKPQLVTWLQIGSLAVKVPLTLWFAFGGLGIPALGAAGCAWATVVVNLLLAGVALWLVRGQPLYAPYAIWRRVEPPDWAMLRHFLRTGVPAGLVILVEVTSFTLMALFVARQGAVPTAAHQIASNLAATFFMVPLSIGIATSARVSYWLGAGDPKRARAALRTGLRMGLGFALGLAVFALAAREPVAEVYSAQADVAALAASLIGWVALYHIGDATQGIAVFALRSYRVVIAPLVAYCALLWGVGLGGGVLLAYRGIGPWPALHSPLAFWLCAAAALAVLSVTLLLILWRAVRAYPHAPATAAGSPGS